MIDQGGRQPPRELLWILRYMKEGVAPSSCVCVCVCVCAVCVCVYIAALYVCVGAGGGRYREMCVGVGTPVHA